jgi:putative molybdopterin biosynthesis protein
VTEGLGRVATAPVRAVWPAPRFTCAAMDGIAFSADSAVFAGHAAGRWRLAPGSFAWVDTGNPMPQNADTVVERERVRSHPDGSVDVIGPAPRGHHVRSAGEDFEADHELVPAGHRLRPSDLAAVAAAGHATLTVARQPVVALIPTGNEIQPAGSEPRPGGVVDSNSLMLAARAVEIGAQPVVSDVQPDDEATIVAEVRRASQGADLVLIIAGSSAGRGDHTAAVIAQVGSLSVRGVGVRPGHPVLLGHTLASRLPPETGAGRSRTTVPVIGVPGYPVAAAVTFELFAVPLLLALQGASPAGDAARQVQLACDWTSPPEAEDWVPVSLSSAPADPDATGPVVATPGGHGAGAISRLLNADAWWQIPVGQGKFARGDLIEVRQLPTLS